MVPLGRGRRQDPASGVAFWLPMTTGEAATRAAGALGPQSAVGLAGSQPRVSGKAVVNWRFKRHNGAMPSVQIKDVPEQTHAVLRQRAAAAHQSLQEYLRARLIEEASQPTLDEILDRAGGRSGGSVPFKAAVAALRADRDRG
jgi:hypothetical protein